MRYQLLTCVCLLLAACPLRAQLSPVAKESVRKADPLPGPHFAERPINTQLYGVDDGLSQGLIYSMTLDHYGRLWLATKDGLNCYTGQNFRTYHHDPNDAFSMAHDQVKSLSTDSLGRLWLVYANGALGRFDTATETFSLLSTQPATHLNFTHVQRLPDGSMLLRNADSTLHHMHYLAPVLPDNPTLKLQPLSTFFPGIPRPAALFELQGAVLQVTDQGVLWLAVLDSIHRYGPLPGGHEPGWSHFGIAQAGNAQYERYVNFIADPEGQSAYVVDSNLVMHRYDHLHNAFRPMLRLPPNTRLSGGAFLDTRKRLYLFHNDAELLRINTRDATCERLKPQWNRSFLSLNMQLRTTVQDAQGNVWIGTPGAGVVQIGYNNERFAAFRHPFKTYQNGVYQYRSEDFRHFHHFDPKTWEAWEDYRQKYQPNSLFHARPATDTKGHFWVMATEGSNLILQRIDPESDRREVLLSEPPGAHHFGRHLFMGRDGSPWTSLNLPDQAPGLWTYQLATGQVRSYAIPPMPPDGDYPGISDAYESPEGHWWLATTRGLFFFNPDNADWKQFSNIPGDTTSLSADLLLSICPDPARPGRYLWIGTEGAGLNRFDLQHSTFRRFNTTHGLPNNVVYGILPDQRNNLWISTNQGLSHFHVKEEIFVNYSASSGLAGNEFNRYEFATGPEGNLYFGGTAGLTVIYPDLFYAEAPPSTTLITGLKLQNIPQHFHPDSLGLLTGPIHAAARLKLPYNHRMVAFTFANFDLSNPAENEFKYMLEGFDQDWIEAGTATEATYTNLNPGNYIFKVLGRNSFNIWNEQPASLAITIRTPWWATWWFRGLMLFLVATALYGLYRYRLNSLLGMERLRNSIAQDLHDEIGSTLSSISLYSAVMQKSSTALPQNTHTILNKIIDSTSEIMEKMSDMVWTIKSDNDHFDQVVRRMRAFAANVTDSKNVALHFDADPKVEALRLDMDQRKNIYLIYKEAVINALKYSGCKTLRIHLRKVGKDVELTVSDDGCGFDPQASDTSKGLLGGNGISGMQTRAASLNAIFLIDSAPDRGTTLHLTLRQNH